MICRYFNEGERLNVADLNEITVLIDRGETALTEVGMNSWRAGLVGPPHQHTGKEQIFYVTSGEGTVKVGSDTFRVAAGHLVYVPPGTVHQTIAAEDQPLVYFLFNGFLSDDKEGHLSFADHIGKVQAVRKHQAESAWRDREEVSVPSSGSPGRHVADLSHGKLYDFGSNSTRLLLDHSETQRSEVVVVAWPPGNRGAMVAHKEKEQTFFILKGSGKVVIGEEEATVKPGHVVFVPKNTPHTTEAGNDELSYLCFNTYITTQDSSFDEMYRRMHRNALPAGKAGTYRLANNGNGQD